MSEVFLVGFYLAISYLLRSLAVWDEIPPAWENRLSRVTIFAKGNLDIRDSLHSLNVGGKVVWNGVNEIVRARFPGWVVKLRHELLTRSDMLCDADGVVPAELSERPLPLAPYQPEIQFSQALFENNANVFVLSLQPDVTNTLVRHKKDGYLFYPQNYRDWPAADQSWLRGTFDLVPLLDVDASMDNFAKIAARLRARSEAPILVYNLSSVILGESVHCHEGMEYLLSTRIRRFNLRLIELSQRTGISIIDVDAIIARGGADRLKLDAVHLNAESCRLVAAEVVRILEEFGCFRTGNQ